MEQPFPTTAVIFLHWKEISDEISKAASLEQRLPDHLNPHASGFLHSCQDHPAYHRGTLAVDLLHGPSSLFSQEKGRCCEDKLWQSAAEWQDDIPAQNLAGARTSVLSGCQHKIQAVLPSQGEHAVPNTSYCIYLT